MGRLFSILLASFTVSGGLCQSQGAYAGGFYLSEIGTPASLGTAGAANVTNTISADSAWTNPAGMTGLQTDEMMGGLQVLAPYIQFDSSIAEAGGNDGHNAGNTAVIPSFFYVKAIDKRTRLGFSVTAPLGGGLNYGDNFVGRYGATKATLQGVALSPSVGFAVNDRLSLGAGVSILYTHFEQFIAINFPGPAPDGKVKMENLTDWGYQPFAGLTYQLSNKALLGLVYRAEADIDLDGDLNFRNMPAGFSPPANKVDLSWDNPQLLQAGVRYHLRDDLIAFVSADWEDWSTFSENRLEVSGGTLNPNATLDRNWEDTWNISAGMLRESGDRLYSFGVSYDSSVVEDEDRTIDLPLDEIFKFSAAVGWEGGAALDFALGATLAYFGEGKVDQTAQGVRFKGKFDQNYVLFLGGTIRYVF